MKNAKLVLGLFIIVAVLQLAAPLYMAWHWENILQTGSQYYWQTAPVDPYDALKGRYVDLGFKEQKGPLVGNSNLEQGQIAYALLAKDANGHTVISSVSASQPAETSYVRVKVSYTKDNIVQVELPFRRYYIQEDLAFAAEQAYHQRAAKEGTAAVRIKDGYGVIEQLYIGDESIYEYLRGKK
ncbi:MAG TPA: GDYXXLXY domain-containing protein [Negativicutes bacterium]|jgi:uncharacterized membrane-anchored protein